MGRAKGSHLGGSRHTNNNKTQSQTNSPLLYLQQYRQGPRYRTPDKEPPIHREETPHYGIVDKFLYCLKCDRGIYGIKLGVSSCGMMWRTRALSDALLCRQNENDHRWRASEYLLSVRCNTFAIGKQSKQASMLHCTQKQSCIIHASPVRVLGTHKKNEWSTAAPRTRRCASRLFSPGLETRHSMTRLSWFDRRLSQRVTSSVRSVS